MSKIKVLCLPSDRTGVSKFRSVEPHMKLQELYNEDFHVDIITAGTLDFNWEDENFLKKYDIIHFHRTLPVIKDNRIQQVYSDDIQPILDKVHKLGIITIMDLDDYWLPTKEHPAYHMIVNSGLPKKIKDNVSKVNYVSTTTPLFAKEIATLNKNVMVLPNTVDPSEKQFTPNTEKNERLRFGWLGGSSHYHDLNIIGKEVSRFLSENKETTQMVLCGFDTRGNITEIDKNTGQQRVRKIKPEESIWVKFEKMFTKDYGVIDEEYLKQLLKYDQESDKSFNNINEIYRRVWTKPITTYASNYNLFDVSMAPLVEHDFNKNKSQLKVIEAGFHKKALIAQNYGPYQIDCINLFNYGGGINEKGNAILIDSRKNHKDWYKAIKKLYDNPSLVELLSNNLYETVKEKYHIDTVTHTRAEWYKKILQDNKKEVEQLIQESNAI